MGEIKRGDVNTGEEIDLKKTGDIIVDQMVVEKETQELYQHAEFNDNAYNKPVEINNVE